MSLTHYHPANFFSWILMKIGESVRLGVLRKVIKGMFERKKFCPRYLSLKICQSVFRVNATFVFINEFS